MKHYYYLLMFVFLSQTAFSQNRYWILAPDFYDNQLNVFSPLPTDPSGYQGQAANNAQNIITDADGKIVFFIVDENIYSRKGKLIEVFGISTAPQFQVNGRGREIVVVPDPKDCNLFHLLSTNKSNEAGVSYNDAYYAKLRVAYTSEGEVTENSGFVLSNPEDCESKYTSLYSIIGNQLYGENNFHDEIPKFAVSPKNLDGEHKVFISSGFDLFVLTLNESGLTYSGNFINLNADGSPLRMVAQMLENQELEVVQLLNGNYRVGQAVIFTNVAPGATPKIGVAVYDFDPNGNYIPLSLKLMGYNSSDLISVASVNKIQSIEFSPSGNKLFVSHTNHVQTGSTLDYWDISGAPVKTELSTLDEFKYGQIEADVNGNILIPRQNYLAEISNPDGLPVLNPTAISIPSYPISTGTVDFPSSLSRILQDQIDGMDYSTIDPNIYDAVEYEATGTATWKPNTLANSYNNNPLIYGFGSITYIEKELRIKAGSNIRIENMTIKFAPGARLIIENGINGQQGGKLTLQNTVLINDERCKKDSLWLGVEVWGNQNANQGSVFNTTQGVLRMFGTSRIENAHIGALIGKRTVEVVNTVQNFDQYCNSTSGDVYDIEVIIPNSYENASNGGIIQVNAGSVFYNNPMGVWFKTYTPQNLANNLSYFKATEFNWENVLLENKTPNTHINLESVKGIKVNGCSFLLDDPSLYSEIGQGFGIRARESQFYVDNFCPQLTQVGQPCPNPTPTSFINLSYGIHTTNANALTYEVKNSEFENCRYGIFTTGTDAERITKNRFSVRELENLQTAGIVLSNSTGYTVEENTFYEFDNVAVAHGDGNSYGILVNNSGVAHNKIYKNYFSNLKIGGQAQNINGVNDATLNNPSRVGLQWKCNTFTTDIYEADLGVRGIIDYQQGYLESSSLQAAKNAAAGNRFSLDNESSSLFPDHDIKVHPSSAQFSYVFIDANTHRPDNYTVSKVSIAEAQFGGVDVTSTGNICPSNLTSKVIKLKEEFNQKSIEINAIEEKEAIGSSSSLIIMIQQNGASQSTFQTLLINSPYLSDAVLSTYIASNASAGFKKEVLIANSKLSASIIDEVMNSSLPNGSKNQILGAQNGFSEKENAVQTIYYLKNEKSSLFNQIASRLLLDTNELATTDLYEEFLKEVGDKDALRKLLEVYIDKGIQENDSLYTLIDPIVCDDYVDLSLVKEDLKLSTAVCDGLMNDPSLVDRLDYIVGGTNTCVAARAKCLLDFMEPVVEVPTFLPLDGPSMIMIPSENSTSSQEYQPLEVKVSMYPNPSTGQVYFDLPDFEEGALQIQLFDITGKEVYSVSYFNTNGELVDFTSLKKGTYIVRITLGNDYNESHLLQLND